MHCRSAVLPTSIDRLLLMSLPSATATSHECRCRPCIELEPKFIALADRFPAIRFYTVDVDANDTAANRAGISVRPGPTSKCI